MDSQYEPPGYWSFPPMFTLQPNPIVRDKQLQLWTRLILGYHSKKNLHRLVPASFELFEVTMFIFYLSFADSITSCFIYPSFSLKKNPNIPRSLGEEGRSAVVSYLINNKHAEWDDGSKTSLRLIFKTSETLAGEIFSWAESKGNLSTHKQTILFNPFHPYAFPGITGSVLTIYELCKGEEYQNTSFFGSDYTSLKAALEVLQGNFIYQLA